MADRHRPRRIGRVALVGGDEGLARQPAEHGEDRLEPRIVRGHGRRAARRGPRPPCARGRPRSRPARPAPRARCGSRPAGRPSPGPTGQRKQEGAAPAHRFAAAFGAGEPRISERAGERPGRAERPAGDHVARIMDAEIDARDADQQGQQDRDADDDRSAAPAPARCGRARRRGSDRRSPNRWHGRSGSWTRSRRPDGEPGSGAAGRRHA